MKKILVTLTRQDTGEEVTILGSRLGASDCFARTPDLDTPRQQNVTHIPTGTVVLWGGSLAHARDLVTKLESTSVDWTETRLSYFEEKAEELRPVVEDVARAHAVPARPRKKTALQRVLESPLWRGSRVEVVPDRSFLDDENPCKSQHCRDASNHERLPGSSVRKPLYGHWRAFPAVRLLHPSGAKAIVRATPEDVRTVKP